MDNLVIDCGSGDTTTVPLPPDQAAQLAANAAAAVAAQSALDATRQQLLAAVQAKADTDPGFAALAQLAGVLPMPGA